MPDHPDATTAPDTGRAQPILAGIVSRLGKLIQAIPTSLAQAMLAGVLLPLCLQPVNAFAATPAVIAPIVLVWLVLQRFSQRWAVPAAFGAAAIVIAIDVSRQDRIPRALDLIPRIDPTMPHWTWQAIVGIALPLYIFGIGSAFWALVVGLVLRWVLARKPIE